MAQIIVNTCFDAVFQDLLLFISPGLFHFMTRCFEIHLKFCAQKAAFWRNSVIIDFLENESIFSQTK